MLCNLGLEDEFMDSGLVLITSIIWCGPDEERVCRLTGLDPEFVRTRAERLRRAQIWGSDGKVYMEELEDESHFGIWIVLATACADGLLQRKLGTPTEARVL